MRKFMIFQALIILVLGAFSVVTAEARGVGSYVWGPPKSDFVRPHLEEAKIPHNSRWANDQWSPQDWIDSRGGDAVTVVNGLYEADIIVDQYFDGDAPILEVGQGFIELGAEDKRRVVAFIDEVFGVTKFAKPGVILIQFHEYDEPVGVFTAEGLQLQ